MFNDISGLKEVLRAEYKGRLVLLESVMKLQKNLFEWLFTEVNPKISQAATLAGFYPLRDEPSVLPVLERWLGGGRQLYLPAYQEDAGQYALAAVGGLGDAWLISGKYRIPEPRKDLPLSFPPFSGQYPAIWLVPGVAFGRSGQRLGRGRGWYDRLLYKASGIKVGVCLSNRITDDIPVLSHDVRMDFLLTEDGISPC